MKLTGTKIAASLASLALVAFMAPGVAEAKPAKCQLEVDGRIQMTGACEFESLKDGSGSFYAYDNDSTIFAVLLVYEGGAQGHWNEGESHAHSSLGDMKRSKQDGACWVSDTAKLCAW